MVALLTSEQHFTYFYAPQKAEKNAVRKHFAFGRRFALAAQPKITSGMSAVSA